MVETQPALPNLRLIRYRGQLILIEAATARAMAAMSRAFRRSEAERREHEVNSTDLGCKLEKIEPKPGHWEGARLPVTHIVGIGQIWNGPPKRHELCKNRRLHRGEYCPDCHRLGGGAALLGYRTKSDGHEPAKFRPKGST